MSRLNDDWDDLYQDLDDMPASRAAGRLRGLNRPAKGKKKGPSRPAPAPQPVGGDEEEFKFSYQASRYEEGWLLQSLDEFYRLHWFDDLLRLIKGGKEASVYQVKGNQTTGERYLAAKVYRPRKFRSLRNDHLYREGREDLDGDGHLITDDRMLRAMRKRTAFGRELLHTSWLEHEFKTMQILFEAGADVPRPYASAGNAILMSYLGDDELGAPALSEVELEPGEARGLYQRVVWNIELMLASSRVHGDLSAYNILYHQGRIMLIDFPQAMNTRQNHNTYRVFQRDVARVCAYFARFGVAEDAWRLAEKLWSAQRLRSLPEIDPRYLDEESETDRALWRGRRA